MQHRNRFFTVFKIAGLVGALCPTLALAAPQNPPSAPVTVVNTPANPVPVTGSLGVSGAVSISGTVPVTQSGTWNLGVAGTVKTKNIDERGRNPFTGQAFCNQDSGNSCSVLMPPVPAGKRLVLEYVSGHMQVQTKAGAVGVQDFFITVDGTDTELHLPARLMGSNDGTENYVVSERILMFAEAGTVLKIAFSSWEVNMSGLARLSGYLIDLSQ